ncbi:MAG: conjugal transfer protein TrbI [Desulfovibrio sp.]|jgi:type IV secretion system protein VirB10|nr:conjugal transfer protein TrbI [Desulfovibrio sp.]
MKDDSPNSLAPANRVSVRRMNRWPLYAGCFVLAVLFGVLVYSVNFAHNEEEEEAKAKRVEIQEPDRPLVAGEGQGLAGKPPAQAVATPGSDPSSRAEPLILVVPEKESASSYAQEKENLRRMKAQAQLTALSSPLVAKKVTERRSPDSAGAAPRESAGKSANLPAFPASPAQSSYDVEAARDREGFLGRAQSDPDWISPHARMAGQPFELKTGSVIPGVMLTGINSDLPGAIIAQVARNVYDSASGRHLLIPQGSRLYGSYDSRVVFGQGRVLIAWNRILFPDGTALTLGAMPGADMSGYAGFEDQVNNHYLRIYGNALVMSLIMGGMAYTMDSLNTSGSSNSNDNSVSMQDEMVSALASQLGQVSTQVLQKNFNLSPTLEIRPGYQFNIIITKDLVFSEPYQAAR